MYRQTIFMAVAFFGFILLFANLTAMECADADKETTTEIMKESSKNGTENSPNENDEKLRKLFVGGLSDRTNKETLRNYFKQFGEIEHVNIIKNQPNQNFPYAFVTMKEEKEAKMALEANSPIIDGRMWNVKVSVGEYRKNKRHLAAPSNSSRQLPQSQRRIYNYSNPGQMENKNLAYNTHWSPQSYHSLNQWPQTQPHQHAQQSWQSSPSVHFVPHDWSGPADRSTTIVRLPPLALLAHQKSMEKSRLGSGSFMHMSMDPTVSYTTSQPSSRNFNDEQSWLKQSKSASALSREKGSTNQIHPSHMETNAKIGKRTRPTSAVVDRQTGSSSHSHPFAFNTEYFPELHSVKSNIDRENKPNIAIDVNKKVSKIEEDVKSIKELEGKEKKIAEKDDPKYASHVESNFGNTENLANNEPENVAISADNDERKKEKKGASKAGIEKMKMSWADMAEEEEKNNEKTKEKTTENKNNLSHTSAFKSISEHHPSMEINTQGETEGKEKVEIGNSTIDDHKKDEEKKHSKLSMKEFPKIHGKKEKHVDEHSPANQDDKLIKGNVNKPIIKDEVLVVPPVKSYLNVAQTPQTQITTKKDEMLNLVRASTSKIGSENVKKNNLPKEIERKGQENDDKRKLFVGRLPYNNMTNEKLREYFGKFGEVEKAVLTGQGVEYVTMKEQTDAQKILNNPPIIDGRKLNVEVYEEGKRKSKSLATHSNLPNQLAPLQRGKKVNPDQVIEEKISNANMADKHLPAMTSGIKGKQFVGHFPAEQDHFLMKDDVDNSIKNDQDRALAHEKSYLNALYKQILQPTSKNYNVEHPASTSKVGSENSIKKNEENGQERQSYASALLKEKSEDHPTMEEQTHGEVGGKATEDEGTVEHSKIQQMSQHSQNPDMEEMSVFEETTVDRDDGLSEGNDETGDNSSHHDPIHPSSSKEQGEYSGRTKKGNKNKKKKKGSAKNVAVRGNKAETSELADLGDSLQIREEKNENKSTNAGTSSDLMTKVANQRAVERLIERANYLHNSLIHFNYRKFLNLEIVRPKINEHYEFLLNDALLNHLDLENTVNETGNLIEGGLQERHLKYIRLIGAGSLRQQIEPKSYDIEMREEDMIALASIGRYHIAKAYRQQRQIFAIYQLALVKRIAERFNVTPAHVTVEDIYFDESDDESEKKFLEEKYGYTTIISDDEKKVNLVEIPNQVAKMDPDEVTLIIILNCPIKMTTDLIKSYGEHSKQLILMESTMNDLYSKKYTNKEDRKNFQENRRQFQIRKPLPTTFWSDKVFLQKGVKDVQICYAKMKKS